MLAASLRGRLPPSGLEFQSHPPSLSFAPGLPEVGLEHEGVVPGAEDDPVPVGRAHETVDGTRG